MPSGDCDKQRAAARHANNATRRPANAGNSASRWPASMRWPYDTSSIAPHMLAALSALPPGASRQVLQQALAALGMAKPTGRPFAISTAYAQVARAYRSLTALESSEVCWDAALYWGRCIGSTDHVVDLLCEGCETAASRAEQQEAERAGSGHEARERARQQAFEASALSNQVADGDWEVKVLLRVSDVLDRCGNPDAAALLQTRALRLMSGSLDTSQVDPHLLPGIGRLADG